MKFLKPKYKYNPETLQFDKIDFSFKRILARAVPYMATSFVFGSLVMFAYIVLFESPEEKELRDEVAFLQNYFEEFDARLQVNDSLLTEFALKDNQIYRLAFDQDAIPFTIRNSGIGGRNLYEDLEGYKNTELVKNIARKLDYIENKLNVQSLSYIELIKEAQLRNVEFSSMPILQPIHINELTRLSSHFGYRNHPIFGIPMMHKGVDFTAPTGTPVYASGDGVIKRIEKSKGRRGYGNLIDIDHGVDGLTSRYAHLHTFSVKEGDVVKRGQQIGTVGNTGQSTAPHLHYEIQINGSAINPLRYMFAPQPDEYEELIEMAKLPGKSFD